MTNWKQRAEKAEADLYVMTRNRDYWDDRSNKAEAERDKLIADRDEYASQLVDEVHVGAQLRRRAEEAEADRDRWKALAEHDQERAETLSDTAAHWQDQAILRAGGITVDGEVFIPIHNARSMKILRETLRRLGKWHVDEVDEEVEEEIVPVPSERQALLNEAGELIHGDRNVAYGPPMRNFQRIAELWNIYLDDQLTKPIQPSQVGWLSMLIKVARNIEAPKRDNAVDAVGYIACAHECQVNEQG